MKASHSLILVAAVLIGAVLRVWNLDSKPLWMDEVITALFSSGRSYYDVPLEKAFSLSVLDQVFAFRSATCTEIAETVSVQSVHPPLFFCWLHHWLNGLHSIAASWIWQLRSLPALAGVVLIVAVYYLNRVTFSIAAGLTAAFAMAVSPFAVYLSQEARHYTIPMLLITLALLGLVRIVQELRSPILHPEIWLGWAAVNSVGFYVHYFFILATIAQILTLIVLLKLSPVRRAHWLALMGAIGGIGLSYLPWLPTFVSHLSRPETDWLHSTEPGWLQAIAPLYQLVAGWLVMVIALPVENQPLWVAILSALLMLLFGVWLGWRVLRGMRRLWHDPHTHRETLTLIMFVGWVLLEFLAIIYGLGKDISQVPRYNFIYYPAVCALLGASLAAGQTDATEVSVSRSPNSKIVALLLVGLLSSGFVVNDRVFLKPYLPQQVAEDMRVTAESSLVVMAYEDFQDIALGLSFALALRRDSEKTNFAFLRRSQGYEHLWRNLATLKASAQNLWMIAPGLRRTDFPAQLALGQLACRSDATRYHRIGIPYQGYRCDR